MNHFNFKARRHDHDRILTNALIKLATFYDLNGKDLSEIIGMSETSATRLNKGIKLISDKTKEGEIVLLLIRLYRGLNTLVGNDLNKAKAWLNSYNSYFLKCPIDHIKRIDGLVEVVNYLDAMRGKI